jgi:hypothetical protein
LIIFETTDGEITWPSIEAVPVISLKIVKKPQKQGVKADSRAVGTLKTTQIARPKPVRKADRIATAAIKNSGAVAVLT